MSDECGKKTARILAIAADDVARRQLEDTITKACRRLMCVWTENRWSDATPDRAVVPHYEIETAPATEDGLRMLIDASQSGRPFGLAVVDQDSGDSDAGIETIRQIWDTDPEIQTLLCAARVDGLATEIIAQLGASDRIMLVAKPLDTANMELMVLSLTEKWHLLHQLNDRLRQQQQNFQDATRVLAIIESCEAELEVAQDELHGMTAELSERLQQRTTEILETRNVTVFALARLAESRDQETGEHLERLREFAQILAVHLSCHGPYQDHIDEQFLHDFYLSTPLHDIGKVGITDSILLKPERLTSCEFERMKQHTVIGAEALETASKRSSNNCFFALAATIARHHHEHFDGTGYPDGLRGQDIPLAARIVAIADVFDALMSKRVYRDPYPLQMVIRIIHEGRGTHFDPNIVDAFDECLEKLLKARAQISAPESTATEQLDIVVV